MESDQFTIDTFFNGKIQVKQSRTGYRFSIDSVLIAAHVKPRRDNTILDLGTGCGILPMILAYRNPIIKIYGVEVQMELADLAKLNVIENHMENRITVLCQDMKRLKLDIIPEPVDIVITNPPYRKSESGRLNPDRQKAIARHEIMVDLGDVIETARRMLKTAGKFITIYPAERMTDILSLMRSAGIEPKFMKMVHSGLGSGAKLILIEGKKGGRSGLKIGPPLVIYNKDGSYSEEVERMFMP